MDKRDLEWRDLGWARLGGKARPGGKWKENLLRMVS